MCRVVPFLFGLAIGILLIDTASAAGLQHFTAAYAAAEKANEQAAANKNQWTTAVKALSGAKEAAATGDYDRAVRLANEAEALSKAAIEQSKREETAWKDAVIR